MTAGLLLNAAILAIMVAASHPVATGLVVATGVGAYALGGIVRRAGIERTFLFCRGGFCLRLQLSVG